jgi:hypothetical protein
MEGILGKVTKVAASHNHNRDGRCCRPFARGQVVYDHLKACVLQGPRKDMAPAGSEIPGRAERSHWANVLDKFPTGARERSPSRISLWTCLDFSGDSSRDNQSLDQFRQEQEL